MEITPELLKRYTTNECTSAERKAVEQWLDADQPVKQNIPTPGDILLRDEIWANISAAKSVVKRRHSIVTLMKYSGYAAACLLIFLCCASNANLPALGSDIIVDNLTGTRVKTVRVDELEIKVEPGSSCDIKESWFSRERTVKFCGAVAVANISGRSTDLRINTGFASCRENYMDSIALQKGQTYLAMTDDKYKVITATKDELADGLPQAFSARLHKRFNL